MVNLFNFLKNIYVRLFVLLVLVGWWVGWASPQILQIPTDFSDTAEVVSVDNFFDETINDYHGEQYSKTVWSYQVVSSSEGNRVIKNDFAVSTLDNTPIFQVSRLYGIDPKTGQHVSGIGDRDRSGYLFAPRNLKKGQEFDYWHVNYDAPAYMSYVNEEYVQGVRVYKYESNYEGVTVDQTKNLDHLPEVGESRGVELEPKLQIWVEPITGRLIQYQDNTIAYFYDLKTHERLTPWNKFTNRLAESSVEARAKQINNLRLWYLFVQKIVPFGLLLIILFTLLLRTHVLKKNSIIRDEYKLAIAVSILLIFLSGAGFWVTKRLIAKKINIEFSQDVERVKSLLQARMGIYLNVLTGGKALFDSSNEVTRSEWHTYISSLNLQKNYPGIQGVGYASLVKAKEKENFVSSVQAESYPEFTIKPDGERDVYVPVTYLEPFDQRNQRAFGYDMFSEPLRRKAMTKARDTGRVSVTGKIILVQEEEKDTQAGFIAYEPVYEKDKMLDTESQRRLALQGYVYSPFRMNDFMKGVFGSSTSTSNLDIHIYDGLTTAPESFMFDLDSDISKIHEDIHDNQIFKTTQIIYIGDHPWTVEFVNKNSFQPNKLDKILPNLVLGLSLIFSALIVGLILSAGHAKQKAIDYANKLTQDLQNSKIELEEKNKKIQDKLVELDRVNRLMVNRELAMVELKEENKRLKDK